MSPGTRRPVRRLRRLLPVVGLLLLLAPLASCGGEETETYDTTPPELTRLFAVDSLRSPESVAWDSARSRYLITNVAGEPAEEDGNGFVTAVSAPGDSAGSVQRRAMTSGSLGAALDAPRGIDVRGDRAWIADLRTVVGVDLRADTATFELTIRGSRLLNDVAVGPDGMVYVSDSRRDAVYVVDPAGDDWSRHGAAGSLRGVNGLHADPGGPGLLVAGGEGAVLRLDPDSSVTLLADPLDAESLDGIQPYGEDRILYSDFSRGTLHALHRRRPGHWEPSSPWLEGLTTPADFLRRDALLAVPELQADRVVFYRAAERGETP